MVSIRNIATRAKSALNWSIIRQDVVYGVIPLPNFDVQVRSAFKLVSISTRSFLEDPELVSWLRGHNHVDTDAKLVEPVIFKMVEKDVKALIESEYFQKLMNTSFVYHRKDFVSELLTRIVNNVGAVMASANPTIQKALACFSHEDNSGNFYRILTRLGTNSPEICRASEDFRDACIAQFANFRRYPPTELDEAFMNWVNDIREKDLSDKRVAVAMGMLGPDIEKPMDPLDALEALLGITQIDQDHPHLDGP